MNPLKKVSQIYDNRQNLVNWNHKNKSNTLNPELSILDENYYPKPTILIYDYCINYSNQILI